MFSRRVLGLAVGVLVVGSVVINTIYFSRGSSRYVPIRAVDREVTITCEACRHVQKDQLPAVQTRLLRGYPPYDFRVKCEKCGAAAKVSGVYGTDSATGDTTMQEVNDEGK